MDTTVRKSTLKGVSITVVCSKRSFDVFVNIAEGCVLAQKRKNQFFSISFQTTPENRISQSPMSFILHSQKYDEKNLMSNFKWSVTMPNGVSFTFSLRPEFYLSPELVGKFQLKKAKSVGRALERKARKKELAQFFRHCESGSTHSQPKSSGSVYINYSGNNAFKPCQGGGCSSK